MGTCIVSWYSLQFVLKIYAIKTGIWTEMVKRLRDGIGSVLSLMMLT